jgi:hypothetical protein
MACRAPSGFPNRSRRMVFGYCRNCDAKSRETWQDLPRSVARAFVGAETVTHVSGMNCYRCARMDHFRNWRSVKLRKLALSASL